MKFQVTAIAIDWQDDWDWIDPISLEERSQIEEKIVGSIWDLDDEDDLVDAISNAYGWAIESIDYEAECTCDPTCDSGCEVCCEDEPTTPD